MRREDLDTFIDVSLPELDPVVAYETTEYGWRGLTEDGEVLEVSGNNGHAISIPEEVIISHLGRPIGRRVVKNEWPVNIGKYLDHFNRVVEFYKTGRLDEALDLSLTLLDEAPTLRLQFNRAMILLAAGHWKEGLQQYWICEQHMPFKRPQVVKAEAAGMTPWRGEDLYGKRLLLMHAHGFGDTIQMMRYIPELKAMGADVVLMAPKELHRLAQPLCHTVEGWMECDYFCPILHLLFWLDVTPANVIGVPYLHVPETARCNLASTERRKIGVAWSVGKPSAGDYPREVALSKILDIVGDADVYSMQVQGGMEAKSLGVKTFMYGDFADCAAMMLLMDEIICVDTAALHLAGAIGHPKVTGLLSPWHSWRWLAPWYDNVQLRVV